MQAVSAETNRTSHRKPQSQKKTKQKEAILRVLSNTTSHPTAVWIYDEVRKEIPHISLGTVYRNLKLLAAQGVISELEISGGGRRFETNTSSHYHFLCDRCGQVFHIDETVTEKLGWEISQGTGFEISEYQLEFHGLCRECQEG